MSGVASIMKDLTHQPKTGGFVKPRGNGHFVGLDPLVKMGYRR